MKIGLLLYFFQQLLLLYFMFSYKQKISYNIAIVKILFWIEIQCKMIIKIFSIYIQIYLNFIIIY